MTTRTKTTDLTNMVVSMGQASMTYEEIRFNTRDPELTQCYVAIRAVGDCPIGVQGWHHKTFPGSKSVLEILQDWADGKEDPVMWALEAP